ncbi:hypothetical protein ACXZ9C_10965 [Streptococcus agalactiae]
MRRGCWLGIAWRTAAFASLRRVRGVVVVALAFVAQSWRQRRVASSLRWSRRGVVRGVAWRGRVVERRVAWRHVGMRRRGVGRVGRRGVAVGVASAPRGWLVALVASRSGVAALASRRVAWRQSWRRRLASSRRVVVVGRVAGLAYSQHHRRRRVAWLVAWRRWFRGFVM